jgi:Uma2 family endonuclease
MTATPCIEPRVRRFSSDEFYRLVDLGWFNGQRVELIEGEIIEMPAQKNHHLAAITLARDALAQVFGPGFWVRVQGTLDLTPWSTPDPDLAVVAGSPRGCAAANPKTALLVIEVSDTTLTYDRGTKGSLYAKAGIADYWIVNLVDRRLEVYRNPLPDARQPFGSGYADVIELESGDFVSPLAQPQNKIPVADLLP